MIITVASGKGGTGKTTISVNLALSLNNVQLLDCDVEEPNCDLFIKSNIIEKKDVFTLVPEINKEKCIFCKKCTQLCEYNAIVVLEDKSFLIKEMCHGCGVCSYFCPEHAIIEQKKHIGVIEKGEKLGLQIITGKLDIGEVMAPFVIKEVKKNINKNQINILDASPGTSCSVVASIIDTDYVILVTEPTPFGLHDLQLAVDLLRSMNILFGVVVNKSDIGDNKVFDYCEKENISILLTIPFKKEISQYYAQGISMVESNSSYKEMFKNLYEKILKQIGNK